MTDHGIPGPRYDAAYERVRARYAHLIPVLAPLAVPRTVRPSVIYGWSRDPVGTEVLARALHFQSHGLPIVLHGTPYEMTP